jgi:hypothetical protein
VRRNAASALQHTDRRIAPAHRHQGSAREGIAMLPSGPRSTPVPAFYPAHTRAVAVAIRRRRRAESSGLVTAIACVAAAVILYMVGSLVWEFDEEGVLRAARITPSLGAIE